MPKFPKGSQEAKDYMASIRAKRGGSCCGGSVVSGNPSAPSGPPPPPPPRPPRPSLTPINTSIDPDQSLINGIEELLASTTLSQARRKQLMEELKRIKERVSGNPQSGSGIIPIFKKPKEKVAPASTDPLTDPEFLALIAESDRVMKEMKERVEKLKKLQEKKGEGIGSSKIAPTEPSTSIYGNETIGERLDKKITIAKATQAGIIRKDNLEKKKKSNMFGRGASASVSAQSVQDQINRKIMERARIIARMATLQREIEDVITAPGPTPMEERMNSISSVLTETGVLTQRLNAINAELEALGERMFDADTDSEGGDTERETDSFEETGMSGSGGGSSKERVMVAREPKDLPPSRRSSLTELLMGNKKLAEENKALAERMALVRERNKLIGMKSLGVIKSDEPIGDVRELAKQMTDNITQEGFQQIVNKGAEMNALMNPPEPAKPKKQAPPSIGRSNAVSNMTDLIKGAKAKKGEEEVVKKGEGVIKSLPKDFMGSGVVRF